MGNTEKGVESFVPKRTRCHAVEDAGKQKTRPNLQPVWEEDTPGLFSTNAKDTGISWRKDTLATYLEDPQKDIPGTKVIFAGTKREKRQIQQTSDSHALFIIKQMSRGFQYEPGSNS